MCMITSTSKWFKMWTTVNTEKHQSYKTPGLPFCNWRVDSILLLSPYYTSQQDFGNVYDTLKTLKSYRTNLIELHFFIIYLYILSFQYSSLILSITLTLLLSTGFVMWSSPSYYPLLFYVPCVILIALGVFFSLLYYVPCIIWIELNVIKYE